MPTVFSPQFLHCLTTSLKNRDSLLFEQAQRCVRRIADLAKLSSVDTQTKVSNPGSLCPRLLRSRFKSGCEPRCCTQQHASEGATAAVCQLLSVASLLWLSVLETAACAHTLWHGKAETVATACLHPGSGRVCWGMQLVLTRCGAGGRKGKAWLSLPAGGPCHHPAADWGGRARQADQDEGGQ